MKSLAHLVRTAVAVALAAAALLTTAGAALAAGEGKVRFVKDASSDFDAYTRNPSPAQAQWMREQFHRAKVYSSYFDSRTAWYPNGWSYRDLYAIYKSSDTATRNPEWILKDGQGRNLYIPYGCGGGSCPQYAGDVGSPAFRAHWIQSMRQRLIGGDYRGIYIDDVNMRFRVGDGNGNSTEPIDPRTGTTMTFTNWRRYIAEFTEQIRSAFPDVEIVHNAIWYADQGDQYVQRAHRAADYIDLERGVTDDGIRGGGGQWGYETYLGYVDRLHTMGKAVVFDSYADTRTEAEYNIASYLLVNESRDGVGTSYRNTPDDWWSAGYELDLGSADGRRYTWNGLLRRDFERGYVLVNQPDRATRTVPTPGATDLDGVSRTAVTLGAGEGAVLLTDLAARPAPTSVAIFPVPNPIRHQGADRGTSKGAAGRPRTGVRPQRSAELRRPSRLRRAVLLRGRVHRRSRGRVTLTIHRKTPSGTRVVRRARVRVSRSGRFARLVRNLAPARYVVVAGYGPSASGKAPLRKRHFKIRW